MNFDTDYELEFEQPRRAKPKKAKAAVKKPPADKQSYESNAEVQRWLQEQALDSTGHKPPFEPALLAGLRERDWLLSSLEHFYEQDLIVDVLNMAKSGKEATVYCCAAHPATGLEYLAAKIYRPRMFRSLKNDAIYRQSREQRDRQGRVRRGQRSRGDQLSAPTKNSLSEHERAARVASWIAYEFETQRRLHTAGGDLPRPWAQVGNAVLMEYVGDADTPAPRLSEVELSLDEAQPLFEQLLRNVELFLAHDRIHGDLSAYNILYWRGAVTIIDFAQAVDPRYSDEIYPLLERDIERLCRYFAPYGVASDPARIASDLWTRYLTREL
jgi:RIO kinase 1